MLNEQQEEKVQELASAFKKLAEISNDDYFFLLLLYPECFKWSLELEEDKDKLLEELSASWKNTAIAPDKFNRDQNYIDTLRWKTHYLKDKMGYSSLRLTYSEVLVKVYEARKNLSENIEKVNDVVEKVKNTETKNRLSEQLAQLFEMFGVLNNNIITPLVELESDIETLRPFFDYPDYAIPEKYVPAFEDIFESIGGVYNDMVLACVATKNMPSEDDLKDKIYSKEFVSAYSNAYPTIQRVNQEALTVISDIQLICDKIERMINGQNNLLVFAKITLNAEYDKVMLSYRTHANELEPLLKATKRELQRLEGEREEKRDSQFDIGIETLSLLAHQLGTVLKMAEICPRYYLEYLTALKEKMLEVAKIQ